LTIWLDNRIAKKCCLKAPKPGGVDVMTRFLGTPEEIDAMMGLPEERWFERLARTADWSTLILQPVGNLAETESVFRRLWAATAWLQVSTPRQFFHDGIDCPEALEACDALRAIGAGRLAEIIEGSSPRPEVPEYSSLDKLRPEEARRAELDWRQKRAAADAWQEQLCNETAKVRGLLIDYLRTRGVFPLERPVGKRPLPFLPLPSDDKLEGDAEIAMRIRLSLAPVCDTCWSYLGTGDMTCTHCGADAREKQAARGARAREEERRLDWPFVSPEDKAAVDEVHAGRLVGEAARAAMDAALARARLRRLQALGDTSSTDTARCRNCNALCKPRDRYCLHCGSSLPHKPGGISPSPESAIAAPGKLTCVRCLTQLAPREAFKVSFRFRGRGIEDSEPGRDGQPTDARSQGPERRPPEPQARMNVVDLRMPDDLRSSRRTYVRSVLSALGDALGERIDCAHCLPCPNCGETDPLALNER
jgi:hypothetical protein